MDQPPASQQSFDYRSEGEHVTDPMQIAALLKKVKDSRTLIQVTLPGHGTEYNSALLDIHPEQGYLLLDELTPTEGHQSVTVQSKLTVSIRLRGVDLRFTGTVQEIGGQAGIAFYLVDFPQSLYYRQRRSYYRVKLGMGLLIPFNIARVDGKPYEGRLDDISLGGIGAELKQLTPFHQGDLLPTCAIQLPSGEKIECEIEVRYLSKDEQHKRFHLGARFVKLDRTRKHILQRFVAEAERELIRRKPKE
jgi:c-di-GMP-binding flagellar brake protein YcgR